MHATMIGLDSAGRFFRSTGRIRRGGLSFRSGCAGDKWWRFSPSCQPRIGIEACGSAHYWGRRLTELGHEVRLIPAAYVKPFVRCNETDARDAAAICVALGRPDMRFVAIKNVEQQAARAIERSRALLVKQHTQLMNSVRSQLAEFGIIAAQGRRGFTTLVQLIAAGEAAVPPLLLKTLRLLVQQIERLASAIAVLEQQIVTAARAHPAMRRLTTIPGVGPLTAHAIVTAIGDGQQFATARDFAAWCGLTRHVDQRADTRRKRGISRQGDCGLRKLLALGASTAPPEDPSRARHPVAARHPRPPPGQGRGPGAGR